MSIVLQKGESINLNKNNINLTNIKVCLGWDPISNKNSFLENLKSIFITKTGLDLDALAIMINDKKEYETICFYHLLSLDNSVRHSGDNLTGEGKNLDKEQIFVDLNKVSKDVNRIIFCVNIYNAILRKQNFGQVQNSFIRIVDIDKNKEFCRYELSGKEYEKYTSMQFGSLIKDNLGNWSFEASGIGYPYSNIRQLEQFLIK